MSKKLIWPIIMSILFCLCGCGGEESIGETVSQETVPQEVNASSDVEMPDTSEEFLASGYQWQDNTLDLYIGQINQSLKPEQPEGARDGGGIRYLLGNSRAAVFKKHLFASFEECWDGLNIVTDRGEELSVHLDFSQEGMNQVWSVGEICGSDNYLMYYKDTGENAELVHTFFVVDTQLNVIDRIGAQELLADIFASDIMMDISGNIHLLNSTMDGWTYYVLDSHGKFLAKYTNDSYSEGKFVPLYDGRIAVCSHVNDENEGVSYFTALWMLDLTDGEERILTTQSIDEGMLYYTLWDASTLVYATQQGVYRRDLSGENAELLYEWSNHGIQLTPDGVKAMCTQGQGLSLLYADSSGMNYLCLKPCTENIEIKEITLAVSSYSRSVYQAYVAEFNRKYPTYSICLAEDYDTTKLLTELTAGDGPVLIDTGLTGFYKHVDLWEPLDDMLAQTQLEDQLLPEVMKLGQIDGTLYGIVGGWSLRTTATASVDMDSWDYSSFLQYIAEHPELHSIYSGQSSWAFISTFFIHSLEDNYLIDTEEGSLRFDSDDFRQILRYAKDLADEKKAVGNQSEMISALREGSMLCCELNLSRPEELSLWRAQLGSSMKYMGYPGQNGSQHYICSSVDPVVIRSTASEEEKKIAQLFLQSLLSYESQSAASSHSYFSGMSVRRDVFEKQMAEMPDVTYFADLLTEEEPVEIKVDKAADTKEFLNLMEQAVPYPYFPSELYFIMAEELDNYFSGVLTEEQVINNMENRVKLYLAEQN